VTLGATNACIEAAYILTVPRGRGQMNQRNDAKCQSEESDVKICFEA
jgi:hypothetical protein